MIEFRYGAEDRALGTHHRRDLFSPVSLVKVSGPGAESYRLSRARTVAGAHSGPSQSRVVSLLSTRQSEVRIARG